MNFIKTSRSIPRSIWALGMVSLFMDASSELVHSLLPVFFWSPPLAASPRWASLKAWLTTAMIVKVFSGTLSDFLGKRKLLTVIGYGLAADEALFPLADTIGLVLTARFMDRIGKGFAAASA